MKFVYPQGKAKALTLSYDDGQIYDRRLVEIFNQNGLKGTFHLNSGKLGFDNEWDHHVTKEEIVKLYAGHEVACHGEHHRTLHNVSEPQAILEILEDRRALEQITGGLVMGMSYAYGHYNQRIKELIRSVGIKYSRTVNSTGGFFPPADFLEWNPTCHHGYRLIELAKQFLQIPDYVDMPLMYVWGHSFEFDRADNWELIEEFARLVGGKEDIWYATNMEICDYITATRSQEYSADGMTMHNPTIYSVWVKTAQGVQEVKPGETKFLGER